MAPSARDFQARKPFASMTLRQKRSKSFAETTLRLKSFCMTTLQRHVPRKILKEEILLTEYGYISPISAKITIDWFQHRG
jgi:hypothetical protein